MRNRDISAVVTGGASGLGAATARSLREIGARVTLLDRDAERGNALADSLEASFIAADVTDEDSVARAMDQARTAMGSITALVNCAGIVIGERTLGRSGPHPLASFRRVVDVNLTGSFNCARLAAAEMAKNSGTEKGVIVLTASIAAFEGQKGQAAYAASKAGVAGMTLPLARDLASFGIRVCAIAPGVIRTPMLESLPAEVQESLAAEVPFPKRLGEPADYAALVLSILGNSYLNGEVIRLDGALRMR